MLYFRTLNENPIIFLISVSMNKKWFASWFCSDITEARNKVWMLYVTEVHPLMLTDPHWGLWVPELQSVCWPCLKATDHLNEHSPVTSVQHWQPLSFPPSVSRILKWLLIKVRWTLLILSLFCLEFPVLACESQMHLFFIIHCTGVRQDEVSSPLRKWVGKGWSAVVLRREVSPAPPSAPGPLTLSSIHQLWCDSDRVLPRSRVTLGVCDICPWWWNIGKALVLLQVLWLKTHTEELFFLLSWLKLEQFEKSMLPGP